MRPSSKRGGDGRGRGRGAVGEQGRKASFNKTNNIGTSSPVFTHSHSCNNQEKGTTKGRQFSRNNFSKIQGISQEKVSPDAMMCSGSSQHHNSSGTGDKPVTANATGPSRKNKITIQLTERDIELGIKFKPGMSQQQLEEKRRNAEEFFARQEDIRLRRLHRRQRRAHLKNRILQKEKALAVAEAVSKVNNRILGKMDDANVSKDDENRSVDDDDLDKERGGGGDGSAHGSRMTSSGRESFERRSTGRDECSYSEEKNNKIKKSKERTNSEGGDHHSIDSSSEYEEDEEEGDPEDYTDTANERPEEYRRGGYHPVLVNDLYKGRYRVVRKLGWGYFSTVWLVWDYDWERFHAMKIQKSASHCHDAAVDEIKLLSEITKSGPHERLCCTRIFDWFEHRGPNGIHICMILDLLGENLLCLIERYENKGVPLPIVKTLARDILMGLDHIHKLQIIHTDIKPENILLNGPKHDFINVMRKYKPPPRSTHLKLEERDLKTMTKSQKRKYYAKIAKKKKESNVQQHQHSQGAERGIKEKEFDGESDTRLNKNFSVSESDEHRKHDTEYDKNFKEDEGETSGNETDPEWEVERYMRCVIADFGNSCHANQQFTDEVQTRQYRAPEVIVGNGYECVVDIWSCACVIFELLTGEFLFDPREYDDCSRDEHHLSLMAEMLNGIPPAISRGHGKYRYHYFNSKGDFRHINDLYHCTLQDILYRRHRFSHKEAGEIAAFLLPMLECDPKKRATAEEMLVNYADWFEFDDDDYPNYCFRDANDHDRRKFFKLLEDYHSGLISDVIYKPLVTVQSNYNDTIFHHDSEDGAEGQAEEGDTHEAKLKKIHDYSGSKQLRNNFIYSIYGTDYKNTYPRTAEREDGSEELSESGEDSRAHSSPRCSNSDEASEGEEQLWEMRKKMQHKDPEEADLSHHLSDNRSWRDSAKTSMRNSFVCRNDEDEQYGRVLYGDGKSVLNLQHVSMDDSSKDNHLHHFRAKNARQCGEGREDALIPELEPSRRMMEDGDEVEVENCDEYVNEESRSVNHRREKNKEMMDSNADSEGFDAEDADDLEAWLMKNSLLRPESLKSLGLTLDDVKQVAMGWTLNDSSKDMAAQAVMQQLLDENQEAPS